MTLARAAALAMMGAAVACGGGSNPVTGPPPAAATLVDVQSEVFTPRCALSGCHVGSGAPLGLDLSSVSTSAANLIGVASAERPALLRVAPGDSASSYLYWKVSGNPDILGDPMPLYGSPLSDGDLNLIASWIDGGAK